MFLRRGEPGTVGAGSLSSAPRVDTGGGDLKT